MTKVMLAKKEDLKEIAKVHKIAYSKLHFTALFSENLLESYYSYFLDNEASILLLKNSEDNIAGFVVSGINLAKKIKQFKYDKKYQIYLTALLHPVSTIRKLINSLCFVLFEKTIPFEEADFLILSIAAVKKQEGTGSILLAEAYELSKKFKYNKVGLYVRTRNIQAINAYLKGKYRIKGYSSGQFYMEKTTYWLTFNQYIRSKNL